MAAPRKVFRIERMGGPRLEPGHAEAPAPLAHDIMQELGALRALLASAPAAMPAPAAASPDNEIQRLTTELRLMRSAIGGTQQPRSADRATAVPPAARVAGDLLSATLKGDFEHGLTQDIRERVIKIFEACNFQDVTSQRVAKVLATFAGLEQQIARALEALTRLPAAPPLHGPGLPGEGGHVSQGEVDALFDDSGPSA